MKYETEIKTDNTYFVNKLLASTPEEMDQPKSTTIWRWTGKFENGMECDVIIHSSDDDFYIDGVLYDQNGCECCVTDVCDELLGEYKFEYEGDEYVCNVKEK